MLTNFAVILLTFTVPQPIGTDPKQMLWMFPLLAAIAIVYKATKTRVIFLGKFFKDTFILFCTISITMILAGIALNLLTWILTT